VKKYLGLLCYSAELIEHQVEQAGPWWIVRKQCQERIYSHAIPTRLMVLYKFALIDWFDCWNVVNNADKIISSWYEIGAWRTVEVVILKADCCWYTAQLLLCLDIRFLGLSGDVLLTRSCVLSWWSGPTSGRLDVKDTEGSERHENQNSRQKSSRCRPYISTSKSHG